jgi:hypothetical protein
MMRQEYRACSFERALDRLERCRFWHTTFELEVAMSHWLTDAALASLETDQFSKARADRHWAAVIIILDLLSP